MHASEVFSSNYGWLESLNVYISALPLISHPSNCLNYSTDKMVYCHPCLVFLLVSRWLGLGSPMQNPCAVINEALDATHAGVKIGLLNEPQSSGKHIADSVNKILDGFIREDDDHRKKSIFSRLGAGITTLAGLTKGFVFFNNNTEIFKMIKGAGAFKIMPRIFEQRAFHLRRATEEQQSLINERMENLLQSYPDFRQTFAKIHAVTEKEFPENAGLPSAENIRSKAKSFQFKFGLAFRDCFQKNLQDMKNKNDYAQLTGWLETIKKVHKDMDGLDQLILERGNDIR